MQAIVGLYIVRFDGLPSNAHRSEGIFFIGSTWEGKPSTWTMYHVVDVVE